MTTLPGGVITWDTLVFEDGSSVGVPTTGYTVPRTGLWLIQVNLGFYDQTFSDTPCDLIAYVLINSGFASFQRFRLYSFGGYAFAHLDELEVGDLVRVVAAPTASNPDDWYLDNSVSGLAIARVGPERWT